MHFFDGFRTSHEVLKVEELSIEKICAMIDDDLIVMAFHKIDTRNPNES